jgi:hypothetical protein
MFQDYTRGFCPPLSHSSALLANHWRLAPERRAMNDRISGQYHCFCSCQCPEISQHCRSDATILPFVGRTGRFPSSLSPFCIQCDLPCGILGDYENWRDSSSLRPLHADVSCVCLHCSQNTDSGHRTCMPNSTCVISTQNHGPADLGSVWSWYSYSVVWPTRIY